METRLRKWQRSLIRASMDRYREGLENYYIRNKRVVETAAGLRAFSLLSPPLRSSAARRRVRFILRDATAEETSVAEDEAVTWGSRTPHFITVAITYECQCDCRHCSAYAYRQEIERSRSALTLPELRDAIRQSVELGTTCVVLTGGEPLLHPGLHELIRCVPPDLSVCTIFTNGEGLTAPVVSRLREDGLFGVFVSLDCADPAEHERNRRRPGLFGKAVDGIRRCQDAGLLTGLSTYATREKIESGALDDMMELARTLGVLEVFLFDLIATGRLERQPDCMLRESDVGEIVHFRKRYNERDDYPRIIHQTMFTSIAYPCAAEGCPAGIAQMHLRANGDVSPCDFTPASFGNVRDRPLGEIWERMARHELFADRSAGCQLRDHAYRERLADLVPGVR